MTSLASERANSRNRRDRTGRQIPLEAIDDDDDDDSTLKFQKKKKDMIE